MIWGIGPADIAARRYRITALKTIKWKGSERGLSIYEVYLIES